MRISIQHSVFNIRYSLFVRIFVLVLIFTDALFCQRKTELHPSPNPPVTLAYNLRLDLLQSISGTSDSLETPTVHKSPFTAALLSIAIPGAGQFYNETYWQSALFLAAEATLWVVYVSYEKKGDQQTTDFQNFADANWSVVDYVRWMQQYYQSESGNIVINPDQNLRPWDRVNWSQVNAAEEAIGLRQPPTGFTHRLAERPEQQYYEMIGKYPQFGGGWSDAGSYLPSDVLSSNVTARFKEYSLMRGDANSSYNKASSAAYLLVANHVLSAVEAAWTAARIDNSVRVESHLEPTVRGHGLVEFVPTASVSVTF
ncbi:MAG: DUF5683 domain-containing protein [Bacteroidota bacterium]